MAKGKMEKRRFGKTNLQLSLIGIGGIPFIHTGEEEVEKVINKGIELGINFIETAYGYKTSEEKIGKAIKGKRDKIILITKSHSPFSSHFEESLKRLGVEYVDVYQIHGLVPHLLPKLEKTGEIDFLLNMKEKGKIKFLGVTSHSPSALIEAMEKDYFTSIQAPINFVEYERYKKALEIAVKKDIGTLAMKPLGGGLFPARESLRFLKFTPISAIPVGMRNEKEVVENVEIISDGTPFSEKERFLLEEQLNKWGDKFCRKCEYCNVCPNGIPVSLLMLTEVVYIRDGIAALIEGNFSEKLKQVDKCKWCKECLKKCPYHLKIPEIIHSYQEKYLPIIENYIKEKKKENNNILQ